MICSTKNEMLIAFYAPTLTGSSVAAAARRHGAVSASKTYVHSKEARRIERRDFVVGDCGRSSPPVSHRLSSIPWSSLEFAATQRHRQLQQSKRLSLAKLSYPSDPDEIGLCLAVLTFGTSSLSEDQAAVAKVFRRTEQESIALAGHRMTIMELVW